MVPPLRAGRQVVEWQCDSGPGADLWLVIEDLASGWADLPLPFSGS